MFFTLDSSDCMQSVSSWSRNSPFSDLWSLLVYIVLYSAGLVSVKFTADLTVNSTDEVIHV